MASWCPTMTPRALILVTPTWYEHAKIFCTFCWVFPKSMSHTASLASDTHKASFASHSERAHWSPQVAAGYAPWQKATESQLLLHLHTRHTLPYTQLALHPDRAHSHPPSGRSTLRSLAEDHRVAAAPPPLHIFRLHWPWPTVCLA